MSGHSFFSIAGVNWWLRRGQRMIRGGLSVVVSFALGRSPEFMVERTKEFTKLETVVEYEVYGVKFEENHLEVVRLTTHSH